MIAAGKDSDFVIEDLINNSMFLVDSSRPAALQFMFERLRFADSFEGITLDIFDEIDDAEGSLAILLNPPSQVFKSVRIKFQASHGLPQMEFRFRDP